MASTSVTIRVDADARDVWALVSDVAAIGTWWPGISSVDASPEGRHRVLHLVDGTVVREEIYFVHDAAREMAYSIVEAPVALDYHRVLLAVTELGSLSEVTATIEVMPPDLREPFDEAMRQGLEALRDHLERIEDVGR